MAAFPVITKSLQEAYEQGTKGSTDKTPDTCGYYGRACRQLEKAEGANRALCQGCGLRVYCEAERPYSYEDWEKAKEQGLDLDDWNDYVKFYGLGEDEQYD